MIIFTRNVLRTRQSLLTTRAASKRCIHNEGKVVTEGVPALERRTLVAKEGRWFYKHFNNSITERTHTLKEDKASAIAESTTIFEKAPVWRGEQWASYKPLLDELQATGEIKAPYESIPVPEGRKLVAKHGKWFYKHSQTPVTEDEHRTIYKTLLIPTSTKTFDTLEKLLLLDNESHITVKPFIDYPKLPLDERVELSVICNKYITKDLNKLRAKFRPLYPLVKRQKSTRIRLFSHLPIQHLSIYEREIRDFAKRTSPFSLVGMPAISGGIWCNIKLKVSSPELVKLRSKLRKNVRTEETDAAGADRTDGVNFMLGLRIQLARQVWEHLRAKFPSGISLGKVHGLALRRHGSVRSLGKVHRRTPHERGGHLQYFPLQGFDALKWVSPKDMLK